MTCPVISPEVVYVQRIAARRRGRSSKRLAAMRATASWRVAIVTVRIWLSCDSKATLIRKESAMTTPTMALADLAEKGADVT